MNPMQRRMQAQQPQQPEPSMAQPPVDPNNPMVRRMQVEQNQNPMSTVAQSLAALKQLPPELQDAYAPHLIRAQMMLEKKGGR